MTPHSHDPHAACSAARLLCGDEHADAPACPGLPGGAMLRLRDGAVLTRSTQPAEAIYVVHRGTLKTVADFPDGRQQVIDFHLPGELVGFDALGEPEHPTETQALHDAEICALPLGRLQAASQEWSRIQRAVHRSMSDRIVRLQQQIVRMAGGVDQRMAAFLLEFAERQCGPGVQPCELVLPMRRTDIASYLGISMESVSRALTRFSRKATIGVAGRRIRLLDDAALRRIAASPG
jgi:CRP/FNR family transcriptional regulator